MPKPSNIEELRLSLLDAYDWVKSDPRRHVQVKEMANVAGKVIGTLKLQLEYAMLRGERPSIEFLGGENTSPTQRLAATIREEIAAKKSKSSPEEGA